MNHLLLNDYSIDAIKWLTENEIDLTLENIQVVMDLLKEEKEEEKELTVIEFVDAFKENDAPYEEVLNDYGFECKKYTDEAYTSEYMIKSDTTGRLCRYLVRLSDNSFQSYISYFGCKKAKTEYETHRDVIAKMSKDDFTTLVCNNQDELYKYRMFDDTELISEMHYCKYTKTDPLICAICRDSKNGIVNKFISRQKIFNATKRINPSLKVQPFSL